MVKPLTEIGIKYQTDKAYFHLFTEFYNDYFEKYIDLPIHILEIGILSGASILMWKEYFPKATIYAIDTNIDSVNLSLGDNVHTYLCSQNDFNKLESLFNGIKFDIIIDDGSHLCSHQQESLGFLFPFLNPTGIYVCEDLHTSFRELYVDTRKKTLEMLEQFPISNTITSSIMTQTQIVYLNENIKEIEIYYRTENALMCYSCKTPNDNYTHCVNCNTLLSPLDKSITSVIIHK